MLFLNNFPQDQTSTKNGEEHITSESVIFSNTASTVS